MQRRDATLNGQKPAVPSSAARIEGLRRVLDPHVVVDRLAVTGQQDQLVVEQPVEDELLPRYVVARAED